MVSVQLLFHEYIVSQMSCQFTGHITEHRNQANAAQLSTLTDSDLINFLMAY